MSNTICISTNITNSTLEKVVAWMHLAWIIGAEHQHFRVLFKNKTMCAKPINQGMLNYKIALQKEQYECKQHYSHSCMPTIQLQN
jgi:hypothetical protein